MRGPLIALTLKLETTPTKVHTVERRGEKAFYVDTYNSQRLRLGINTGYLNELSALLTAGLYTCCSF